MNFQTYAQTVLFRCRPLPAEDQIKHALVGMITEIGELGDIFKRELAYGKAVDNVNVMEECGDFLWYLVLLLETCGMPGQLLDELDLYEIPDDEPSPGLEATFALAYVAGTLGVAYPEELGKELHKHSFELIKGVLSTVQILLNTYGGYSIAECLAKNDAKLEIRTGKVFKAEAILNRDLPAERAALEAE